MLAALGLFGVCSYMVRTRTHEIGVRMALGATRWHVQALVCRRAMVLLCFGAIAGVAGAAGAGQVVAGMLYEVGPFDWKIVGRAVLALAACGSVAMAVPVLRVGRMSPSKALRHE